MRIFTQSGKILGSGERHAIVIHTSCLELNYRMTIVSVIQAAETLGKIKQLPESLLLAKSEQAYCPEIFKLAQGNRPFTRAGVAQLGQRRKTEALIP
jgi:hypothetical protein